MNYLYFNRHISNANQNLLLVNLLVLPLSTLTVYWSSRWGFGWLAAFLSLLLPTRNIVIAMLRMVKPHTHPIVNELRKYGRPEDVARVIQAELLAGKVGIGSAILTKNWLILPQTFRIILVPLENLVWVYELVRGPSPWTEIVLVPRELKATTFGEYQFYMRRHDIQALLDAIEVKRPWIIMGWTPAIHSDMLTRRREVIAYVDQRRIAYLAGDAIPIRHGECRPTLP